MNMCTESALADLLLTVAQLSTPEFMLTFKLEHDQVYINTPAVTYEFSLNSRWNSNPVNSIQRIKSDLIQHIKKSKELS